MLFGAPCCFLEVIIMFPRNYSRFMYTRRINNTLGAEISIRMKWLYIWFTLAASHLIHVQVSHLDLRFELSHVTPLVRWTQLACFLCSFYEGSVVQAVTQLNLKWFLILSSYYERGVRRANWNDSYFLYIWRCSTVSERWDVPITKMQLSQTTTHSVWFEISHLTPLVFTMKSLLKRLIRMYILWLKWGNISRPSRNE